MIQKEKTDHNLWIEVNLASIKANFEQAKSLLARETRVMAVVKANAYGHGMETVAKMLAGVVDFFGVSCFCEANRLRSSGILSPILILGCLLKEDMVKAAEEDISVTVSDYNYAKILSDIGEESGIKIKAHVKIDTGMGRWGLSYCNAYEDIQKMFKLEGLNVEGIFTHFSVADDVAFDYTFRQIELFNALLDELLKKNISFEYVHSANSAGLINFPESHFNMVRPGIMLYGYAPNSLMRNKIELKPALCLKSRISLIKKFHANRGISYGRKFITDKKTKIGVIPIGYSHGYSYAFGQKAHVLINGKRYSIVGSVCMDYCMVDLGDDDICVGDEVVLLGASGKDVVSAYELASLAGTIPYEIITNLNARIPRVFHEI